MKINFFKNNKGMGLIEVIASLGIATVITTSLVALSIFTLRSSLKSKLLLEGSNVANREMEWIRAYRDTVTWSNFNSAINQCKVTGPTDTTIKCHIDYSDLSNVIVVLGEVPTLANLKVDEVSRGFYVLSDSTSTLIKVMVVAKWRDGAQIKSTTLRSDFTNWQNR